MIPAPKPSNDHERLRALRHYGVLDTPPEERFDRIVRLVARQLGVPKAAISLVDLDRQWFKARVGLEPTETPRDLALCAYTIHGDTTFIVEDALNDERFADNPLVTDGPTIRFYAGAPLIASSGHNLGTLCAMDEMPRELSSEDEAFLRDMAAIVVDELELSVSVSALNSHASDLKERNRSLDSFAHILSHDLAGPVRRIGSFCELLNADDGLPAEVCIEHITDSVRIAQRLIRDLRAFFQVDRGDGDTEPECDARECLEGAMEWHSETVEASGCVVQVSGQWPTVKILPGLLVSLLQNLISNGIKYRGEHEPRISIHGVDHGDSWECSIRDNGMGIEEKYLDRVFELLFRLHSEAEIPGCGMGLAVCAKIIGRSGGAIRMESTPGEGSCVTFTLPKEVEASQLSVAG